jgi:spore germination protein
MIIHVVKRGEALWQIADRYNVTIEDIVNLNKLNNPDILLPGHALLIPTGRQTYTVQKGDTIWQIAQKYGVSPQNLLWENRILNPDLIYPGYVLTIPQKPKPEIDVNAFTYFLGSEAVPIVRDAGPYLTYLSPFAYLIKKQL